VSCSRVQAKESGEYTITVEGKKETVNIYLNKISDNIAWGDGRKDEPSISAITRTRCDLQNRPPKLERMETTIKYND